MNEVMNNEVFDDVAVENGSFDSTKKLLIGAGVGFGVAVLGGLLIKKVIKPAISKIRAKRANNQVQYSNADQDTFDEMKYGD